MKKYCLFPHGGSGNHGCEAIVRTIAKNAILQQYIVVGGCKRWQSVST